MERYFTENKIIYYLCRLRANYAQQRSKKHLLHLISGDISLNHHLEDLNNDEQFLREILPPRRKWKKLGKKNRYKSRNQRINSIEYNTKALFKTVLFYRKYYPSEPFVSKLGQFVARIIESLNDPNYEIEKPSVYPKPKKKIDYRKNGVNTCRPISLFSLRDKIIIGLTNKYLTDQFDNQFYKNSHAFRSSLDKSRLVNHHNSVEEIIEYVGKNNSDSLWVAECDMNKFYDTVSHEIILSQFDELVRKCEFTGNNIDKRSKRIFRAFLNSYNFVEDVLQKNDNDKYWEEKGIPNGEFGWVETELKELNHYEDIHQSKIGIPQGGALSGLIANIVLNYADEKVHKVADDELLYLRFCDDMIIIHPKKEACTRAIDEYKNSLIDLKLVRHLPSSEEDLKMKFWDSKSKSPYLWSANHKDDKGFCWIGFVGYEIHFEGHVRVRKSSLKREVNKQKEVVENIISAIEKKKRAKRGTIIESAINRLNGMSVGRIQMWNHQFLEPDMCWTNGFKKLNNNPYLVEQLKLLDRKKNHQIARLKKELSDEKYSDETLVTNENEEVIKRENRKIIYYGKPFSYYGQVLRDKK